MKLTGKTKDEFYYWYYHKSDIPQGTEVELPHFFSYPLEMQIGVLILYFDSVGIFILSSENNSSVSNKTNIFFHCKDDRQQAWTQAVEKANEIREKQLK